MNSKGREREWELKTFLLLRVTSKVVIIIWTVFGAGQIDQSRSWHWDNTRDYRCTQSFIPIWSIFKILHWPMGLLNGTRLSMDGLHFGPLTNLRWIHGFRYKLSDGLDNELVVVKNSRVRQKMNLDHLSRANIISDSFWCYYMPIIELLYILSLKPIKTSHLVFDNTMNITPHEY